MAAVHVHECRYCGDPATAKNQYGDELCDAHQDYQWGQWREVYDHEMRNFGGSYGLPAEPIFTPITDSTPPKGK